MPMRILLITGGSPWPTTLGVNQRTHLLRRALQQCGIVETVIHSRHAEISGAEREYLREAFGVVACFRQQGPGGRWPWRVASRVSPALAERLGGHLGGMGLWYRPQANVASWLARRLREGQYDLIVGRYLRALASSGALDYRPVVLDLDDFDCGIQENRVQQPGLSTPRRYLARRRVRQVERVVWELLRECDHIWVTGREDQELLSSYPTSILPNIPFELNDATGHGPCPPQPQVGANSPSPLLFVGSLRHTVNVRAIDRFLKVVWPRVLKSEPGSEFRIVGYGMTDIQRERWGVVPGVVPVGFVEDLRAEYERCAFAVVPLFEGGGTKIKVLESLRYGRTVVAASHSCRGYTDILRHGEALWEARDEDAIVAGCTRLLRDPGLRNTMAHAGCRLVRQHYSFERFQQVVRETVERTAVAGRGVQLRRSVSRGCGGGKDFVL
jgi:glycosyltransferase involved in cell wall biosynthesis